MPMISKLQLAERSGVEPAFLGRLIGLGILEPDADGELLAGDVRRVRIVHALEDAGLSCCTGTVPIEQHGPWPKEGTGEQARYLPIGEPTQTVLEALGDFIQQALDLP